MEETLSWFVMKTFNIAMYITGIVCIVGIFVFLMKVIYDVLWTVIKGE